MINQFGLESAQSAQSLVLRMTTNPDERDWWDNYLANNPEDGVFPPELTLADVFDELV